MENTSKCYRCGKQVTYNFSTLNKVQKCGHCNALMAIDLKTRRMLKYVQYAMVILVVGALMFVCSQLESMQSYFAVIISVLLATTISMYSEPICLVLTWKIFGLQYMEFHVNKDIKQKVKVKKRRKWNGFQR